MRFEEVPLGWTESRLSQEEADPERLGTTELPGKMIEGSVVHRSLPVLKIRSSEGTEKTVQFYLLLSLNIAFSSLYINH